MYVDADLCCVKHSVPYPVVPVVSVLLVEGYLLLWSIVSDSYFPLISTWMSTVVIFIPGMNDENCFIVRILHVVKPRSLCTWLITHSVYLERECRFSHWYEVIPNHHKDFYSFRSLLAEIGSLSTKFSQAYFLPNDFLPLVANLKEEFVAFMFVETFSYNCDFCVTRDWAHVRFNAFDGVARPHNLWHV